MCFASPPFDWRSPASTASAKSQRFPCLPSSLSDPARCQAFRLRACREITTSRWLLIGRYGVVPFAMEFVVGDVDRLHLLFGYLDTLWVEAGVHLTTGFEAGLGRGGSDQLDDHRVADQRLATPVLADESEQAVLDLVPFAGAGRQMGHRYCQAGLVGETLQFALPQLDPCAVAAPTV